MTRPRHTSSQDRLRRRRKHNGEGFTLLELMIALLILGIVLGSVAPALYGVLRAGTITNYKSAANGIAVQSTEQMRSFAYYEVGYQTDPAACDALVQDPVHRPAGTSATTPPVILSSTTPAPLASLPSSQTVSKVAYSIERCVYWVDSTVTNDTLAYKLTYVKVSWTIDAASSYVVQTSALYPGGNGAYSSGGENDWAPAQTTTTVGTAPSAPTSVTAADDTTNPGYQIDVGWAAVSSASSYNVYFSTTNPGLNAVSSMSNAQVDVGVTGTSDIIDVVPNTNYYIQVVAESSGGSSNPTSASQWPLNSGSTTGPTTTTTTASTTTTVPTGSTTTTTAPTTTTTTIPATTTTTGPCAATSIVPVPAGSTSSPAWLNSDDTLQANGGMFTITVTMSGSGCSPQVAYNTTGCTPGASGCTASYLSTYTVSGNQYTFNTASGTTWTNKSQQKFIPVVGGSYSSYVAQSYVCVENNGGHCK